MPPPEDNVVNFNGVTTLALDPDRVLQAPVGTLESVAVAGYDKEGNEYFASSIADGADVIWILERMKLELLRQADGD